DPGDDAIYLVFNKRNQLEAEERLRGTNVRAMTFNSLGFRALGRGYRIDRDKAQTAWRDMEARGVFTDDKEPRAYLGLCKRLVDLARQVGVGILCPDDVDTWLDLCDEHDLDPQGKDTDVVRGVDLARILLARMVDMARRERVIDFADQLYLSIHPDFRRGCRLPRPDRIFVDETQDLSPVQVELVAAMMGARIGKRPNTSQRVVFVGDRWQAIYGWRGAACD